MDVLIAFWFSPIAPHLPSPDRVLKSIVIINTIIVFPLLLQYWIIPKIGERMGKKIISTAGWFNKNKLLLVIISVINYAITMCRAYHAAKQLPDQQKAATLLAAEEKFMVKNDDYYIKAINNKNIEYGMIKTLTNRIIFSYLVLINTILLALFLVPPLETSDFFAWLKTIISNSPDFFTSLYKTLTSKSSFF
jgi:hypothetical protein